MTAIFLTVVNLFSAMDGFFVSNQARSDQDNKSNRRENIFNKWGRRFSINSLVQQALCQILAFFLSASILGS
jgi:hypothetical protein